MCQPLEFIERLPTSHDQRRHRGEFSPQRCNLFAQFRHFVRKVRFALVVQRLKHLGEVSVVPMWGHLSWCWHFSSFPGPQPLTRHSRGKLRPQAGLLHSIRRYASAPFAVSGIVLHVNPHVGHSCPHPPMVINPCPFGHSPLRMRKSLSMYRSLSPGLPPSTSIRSGSARSISISRPFKPRITQRSFGPARKAAQSAQLSVSRHEFSRRHAGRHHIKPRGVRAGHSLRAPKSCRGRCSGRSSDPTPRRSSPGWPPRFRRSP